MKQSYAWFIIVLTTLALSFASCGSNVVYSRFSPMKSGEWHQDSVVNFDYSIADKETSYQMIVYVRHTERYPYQNMWLFVDNAGQTDTIEFYLADDRGRWLGDRHHGMIEMPVLMEDAKLFPDTGVYRLSVRQGMRDTLLRGITDVGLEVIRNGQE